MKPYVKYPLFALTLAAFVAGAVILHRLNVQKHELDTCEGMDVEFADSLRFVGETDIRRYVSEGYGVFVGQKTSDVNLHRIESIINSKSAVRDCQAWICQDGRLHLLISQRKPLARFQGEDRGFYVDAEGFIFPLFPHYTAPVMVVCGDIPITASSSYKGAAGSKEEQGWIADISDMICIIGKSSWKDRIDSIRVAPNGDLNVRPEGDEVVFNLGEPSDIQDKLHRMDLFYRKIVPFKGNGHYKTVNLKYDGQIICKQ